MVFFLVLFSAALAFSQTVIAVDDNVSLNKGKSLALSVAASAALPGAGHYYLESSRASAFFWVDVSLWFAVGTTYYYSENQLSNARAYAVRYAGAEGAPKDLAFLTTVGKYTSRGGSLYQNSSPGIYEDYNQAMIRAGMEIDSEYPYSAGYIWDWGSSDNPENTARMGEFNDMLRRHRIGKIAFQVSIGAMVLNRVLAVLDAIRIYRQTTANFSRLQINPIMEQKRGFFVNYEF